MITRGFYTALGRLLANADPTAVITSVGFGSANTAESFDDTTLSDDAYIRPIRDIEIDTDNPRLVRIHWTLGPNEAAGLMIRELGLLTDDSVLVARIARATAIEKTTDMELGDWFELQL